MMTTTTNKATTMNKATTPLPSHGIMLININCPDSDLVKCVLKIPYDNIGLFYTLPNGKIHVILLDIFGRKFPTWKESILFDDVIAFKGLEFIDTYDFTDTHDPGVFQKTISTVFNTQIVVTSDNIVKCGLSTPAMTLADLFLAKLGVKCDIRHIDTYLTYTREFYPGVPIRLESVKQFTLDIMPTLLPYLSNIINDKIELRKAVTCDAPDIAKEIIQTMIHERCIDSKALRDIGLIVPEHDIKILVKSDAPCLSENIHTAKEITTDIFFKLRDDIHNDRPIFIDFNRLIENINVLVDQDIPKIPYTRMVGILSDASNGTTDYTHMDNIIIPNKNYSLKSLMSLNTNQLIAIENFICTRDNYTELKNDIKNILLKKQR
jgi:hypothetical protein